MPTTGAHRAARVEAVRMGGMPGAAGVLRCLAAAVLAGSDSPAPLVDLASELRRINDPRPPGLLALLTATGAGRARRPGWAS